MKVKKNLLFYILSLICCLGMTASLFLPFIKVERNKKTIADLSFFDYGVYQIKGEDERKIIQNKAIINNDKETYYEIDMVEAIMDRGSQGTELQRTFILGFFLSIGFGALFLLFSLITIFVGAFLLNKKCKGAKVLAIISTFFYSLFIISTYVLVSTLTSVWSVSPFIYVGLICCVLATISLTLLRKTNLNN